MLNEALASAWSTAWLSRWNEPEHSVPKLDAQIGALVLRLRKKSAFRTFKDIGRNSSHDSNRGFSCSNVYKKGFLRSERLKWR